MIAVFGSAGFSVFTLSFAAEILIYIVLLSVFSSFAPLSWHFPPCFLRSGLEFPLLPVDLSPPDFPALIYASLVLAFQRASVAHPVRFFSLW